MSIADFIPFETFVNAVLELWNVLGISLVLGTFISGITQRIKEYPNVLKLVTKGKSLFIRLFLAILAVLVQVAFELIATGTLSGTDVLVGSMMNYFAASAAYVHLFK